MKRVCADCGRTTDKRRCLVCARAYESMRPSRRATGHYDAEWRRNVAQAIREHPWCSVCRTGGTPDNPLTGDHITPWRDGGSNDRGNIMVLCRACNSSKGARQTTGAG